MNRGWAAPLLSLVQSPSHGEDGPTIPLRIPSGTEEPTTGGTGDLAREWEDRNSRRISDPVERLRLSSRIVIGLCTHSRPIMLSRCLESLAKQSAPAGFSVSIVVVDNEPTQNNRDLVEDFARQCPLPIHYRHEPRRGIAFARNAVLDEALTLEADWIAMLDDDETAAPDWIECLMAPEYLATPILMGRQVFVYPEEMPFWTKPKPAMRRRDVEGIERDRAFTNNVRFSISLVLAGLRFREDLALTSGEDTDFFARAHASGFRIRHTTKAVTFEEAHPDRHTLSAQVYRSYWEAASETRRQLASQPGRRVYWSNAYLALRAWLIGLGRLSIGPFFVVAGLDKAKRRIVSGAKKMGSGAGLLAGLLGIRPSPYRNISGY